MRRFHLILLWPLHLLQMYSGVVQACHMQRQRCKKGLSGLQEAVRDMQRPLHAPGSSFIRSAQEACGYTASTAGPRHRDRLAEQMSDSMAMLHNNRLKLIDSVEALQSATTNLRHSVLSLPSPLSSEQHSAQECQGRSSGNAGPSAVWGMYESTLVVCAACESLREECRLWELLGREGRMDADPDVLYGIDEAVHILGTDLERIFVELLAPGS